MELTGRRRHSALAARPMMNQGGRAARVPLALRWNDKLDLIACGSDKGLEVRLADDSDSMTLGDKLFSFAVL